MSDRDKAYRELMRGVLMGRAYEALFEMKADEPQENARKLGLYIERQSHRASQDALRRAAQLVCPDCTGTDDGHPSCDAQPLRDLIKTEDEKMQYVEALLAEGTNPKPTQE